MKKKETDGKQRGLMNGRILSVIVGLRGQPVVGFSVWCFVVGGGGGGGV